MPRIMHPTGILRANFPSRATLKLIGQMPPTPPEQIAAGSAPQLEQSPVGVYRQAARLNRDPFSKANRSKQTMLLISAVATLLVRLSLLQIESLGTETVKVKLAANSVDQVALVLGCVTAYYPAAFGFGAARDFASDRYRQRVASPELYAPIIRSLDTTAFLEKHASVTDESDRLMKLAFAESSARDERFDQFIRGKQGLDQELESLEDQANDILKNAAIRDEPLDPSVFFLRYSQLKAHNPPLNSSEQEALEATEAAMGDVKNRIAALEKKHKDAFEASQQRETDLRSRSIEVIFAWGRKTEEEQGELSEMIKTVNELRKFRTTTKWIEAIFPCLLGLCAVLLETKYLLNAAWHSLTQLPIR